MSRVLAARLGALALWAVLVWTGAAQAASAPPVAPTVNVDGTVHAMLISGNTLFIAGDFTQVNGNDRRNAAAVSLQNGALIPGWIANTDGPVHALALSSGGATLFLGGAFTTIGEDVPRARLAAVSTLTGNPTAWNPGADGTVRAMARSPDGLTLYVGGDFTEVGGAARSRIASLATSVPPGAANDEPTGGALPWAPEADGPVRVLALGADAVRIYAGGDFSQIGGAERHGLAAIGVASAAALAWAPTLQAGASVRALALGEEVLYAGGAFTAPGVTPRANLAGFSVSTAALTAFDAGADGPVLALALLPDGTRLYAGGDFDAPRHRIAGYRLDTAAGALLAWDPGSDSDAATSVRALAIRSDEGTFLLTGGAFGRLGGADVANFAVFDVTAPTTRVDPPGGSYQAPGLVTLSCEDGAGAGCSRICYRTDGAAPEAPADCDALAEVGPLPVDDTTLRFFSEDQYGQREPLRTEVYAIDNQAPVTTISLSAGLYGIDGIEDVVLECEDDLPEFGCTTYYTLDGSAPDTGSAQYQGPISLASLFPDPSIPADEVDPLLHLAGTVTLRLFSVDGAGNAESVQTRVYEIDLAPPVVTATHPSGNYAGVQQIGLVCDDGRGSGCAEVFYTLDGTLPALDDAGEPLPGTMRYEGPLTLASATTITALARDEAGNGFSGIVGVYAFTGGSSGGPLGIGAVDRVVLLLAGVWLAAFGRRFNGGSGGCR